jgi:hypothetical protein
LERLLERRNETGIMQVLWMFGRLVHTYISLRRRPTRTRKMKFKPAKLLAGNQTERPLETKLGGKSDRTTFLVAKLREIRQSPTETNFGKKNNNL